MRLVLYGPKNPETMRVLAAIVAAERARGEPETELLGFLHSDPALRGTTFADRPIFGGYDAVPDLAAQGAVFVSLVTGSTIGRYETARGIVEAGGTLGKLIHPSVDQAWCSIGPGAYVQESVLIQAEAEIGPNCSIHMGALVAHEVKLGASTFIAHGVSLSGEVTIGDGVFIGTNASVLPRVTIGNFATIGAGAVITKDVPDHAVVVGNPGRVLKTTSAKYAHANPLVAPAPIAQQA
ncbi:MAG: acetyltransferase [Myxococcales bacterium]|nr:acetyltransferase [Myxococcales bacterium]